MTRVVIRLKELDFVQKFRFTRPNLLTVTFDPTMMQPENIAEISAQTSGFTVTLDSP